MPNRDAEHLSGITPDTGGDVCSLLVSRKSLRQAAKQLGIGKTKAGGDARIAVERGELIKVGRGSGTVWNPGPNFFVRDHTPSTPPASVPLRPHNNPIQAHITGEWDETRMRMLGWKIKQEGKVRIYTHKDAHWSFLLQVGPNKARARCWPKSFIYNTAGGSFKAAAAAIDDYRARGRRGLIHLEEYYGVPLEQEKTQWGGFEVGLRCHDPIFREMLKRHGYIQIQLGKSEPVIIDCSLDENGVPYFEGGEIESGILRIFRQLYASDEFPKMEACFYRLEKHLRVLADYALIFNSEKDVIEVEPDGPKGPEEVIKSVKELVG